MYRNWVGELKETIKFLMPVVPPVLFSFDVSEP